MNSRAFLNGAVLLLALGLALPAQAKKHYHHHHRHHRKVLRSLPGGANQRWACKQLEANACSLAKRCDPDHADERCRRLKKRCARAPDRTSRSATRDDVDDCADAVDNLDCDKAKFNNHYGVEFNVHKIPACGPVSHDDPMPPPHNRD